MTPVQCVCCPAGSIIQCKIMDQIPVFITSCCEQLVKVKYSRLICVAEFDYVVKPSNMVAEKLISNKILCLVIYAPLL